MATLFMYREEKLNDEQKECLERIREAVPALTDARRPTRELNGMVRNLEGGKLDGWLAEAEVCAAPARSGLRCLDPASRGRNEL